eukprot:CAMPEP_0175585926 /NCGR_PEP_ID=MMETSP0096-20121207/49973_1 /TAXON_ID=311494 /ORGANISM="Alexandrium monilatum, Strain CCMP3105" /LENGTH=123 /DNA_ID=CAMNT_0016889783 /DNA_START=45 /DNA_END=412 /DNA_ORIENTATION=-
MAAQFAHTRAIGPWGLPSQAAPPISASHIANCARLQVLTQEGLHCAYMNASMMPLIAMQKSNTQYAANTEEACEAAPLGAVEDADHELREARPETRAQPAHAPLQHQERAEQGPLPLWWGGLC